MLDRGKFAGMIVGTLVAAALLAPVASAQPILEQGHQYTSKAYAPKSAAMDMHASTVVAAAAPKQDLRTEGASRTTVTHTEVLPGDLRSENSADPSRAPEAPVGLPTWPLDPKPIVQPAPQTVATDGGDGIDVDWPIALIALFGAAAVGGGLAIAGRRMRTHIPIA
jgi:hypothetical protein